MSATAARLNVKSWNWRDAVLSKAFLETLERKIESSVALEQIAAMDALAAFGSSSDQGACVYDRARRVWLCSGAC